MRDYLLQIFLFLSLQHQNLNKYFLVIKLWIEKNHFNLNGKKFMICKHLVYLKGLVNPSFLIQLNAIINILIFDKTLIYESYNQIICSMDNWTYLKIL